MNTLHRTVLAVFLFAVCLPAVSDAAAPPADAVSDDAQHRSPLGIRQDRVKRLMQDLERKFKAVAQSLEESEPERAERLVKAFQESKHLLIESRMTEISRLLDQSRYDTAGGNQERLIADLRALIKILTEDDEYKRKEDERDRYERWRDEVRRLLETERRHEHESDKIANKDQTLADLERQIKQLERLLARQRNLADETVKTRNDGVAGLPSLADKQRDLRLSTQELAEDVAGSGRGAQAASAADKPAKEPGDSEPSEGGEPAEDGAAKVGEGDGSESGKGGPAEDGSSSDAGSQSGGTGGQGDAGANQPGVQSLRRATEGQKAAEQNLGDNRGKVAEANQQRAIADMEQALEQLRGERSRIATLPPEAFEQMARDQDDTADETARLHEDMSQENRSGGDQSGGGQSGGGQSGGDQSGGKSAPKQQVQNAQKSMRGASHDLRKKDADSAGDDQRDAIAELQKALEEIEQRLAQLREEMAIERLARLEARFREMLARQQPVTLTTAALEKARNENGHLPRSQRLKVVKLAAAERDIDDLAQQALDIIIEDGTSVVFPRIVQNLSEDLQSAATLLDAQRTDSYTQAVQQEIEQTLEELIEALQRAQKQQQQGGGGGGGGGDGIQPLLPPSAELKLLRSAQLRVNRRTKALDAVRGEDPLEDVLELELRKITSLQDQIVKITEEMLERY